MMRFPVYSFLLFLSALLLSPGARAQHTLRGRVQVAGSAQPVAGGEVYVNSLGRAVLTDSLGRFEVAGLAAGRQSVRVSALGYQPLRLDVRLPADGFTFELARRDQKLGEVVVAAPLSTFGQSRLREVEGTAIFAAKKSEVIVPDNLVANLATNNARQVYARVPGLNIWENDGGGLQLSIGGRGLDPNRTSNFNVRQNNYDISADALGYPESYYTPPTEAVKRIQLVRGAASLQYGTQFGGLLNFELRSPAPDRKVALTARQTVGSFGFFNSFNSVSGTVGKLSYYTFAQYKRGNGWRPNSAYDSKTAYADVRYQVAEPLKVGLQVTHMEYLAQQPGGLDDKMFRANARQSNRERNWFAVDWNLFNVNADWKLNARANVNLTAFGLVATRQSLGFRPNRVKTSDDDSYRRELITGDFRNYGLEARYLNRYQVAGKDGVLLLGTRYYRGNTHSQQGVGLGPAGRAANFRFEVVDPLAPTPYSYSDYRFPNHNVAFFAENIFYLSEQFSVTPGLRYEYLRTHAEGFYIQVLDPDLTGNPTQVRRRDEQRDSPRSFLLGGLGVSYKPHEQVEVYANLSQNYRSITFSDMQIVNPSAVIDPNLQDERGFSADLGVRGEQTGRLTYDVSAFVLNYANRIGEVATYDDFDRPLRKRLNIGRALLLGLETYAEAELLPLTGAEESLARRWQWSAFGNVALVRGRYVESQLTGVQGQQVEFVPAVNLKAGTKAGYGPVKAALQFLYLSDQFSDATNSLVSTEAAVIGPIPAYQILDASVSWERRWLKLEASVNNLADARYFTRRATGYPGPGILPSDGRSYFLTVAVKL